jgi:uncharacterized membrane protein
VNIQAQSVEVTQAWSGPLPPPEVLAQYEQILEGAAERILTMAETAITGRIDADKKLAAAEIESTKQGLSFAMRLTIGTTGASAGFFAVAVADVGDTRSALIAGGAFLSVPVVMLIRSFIRRSDG